MVKYIVNILILTLLASSSAYCAADFALLRAPFTPVQAPTTCVLDTSKPGTKPGKQPKQKKERVGNSRKITFENFDQSYERALKFYENHQYLSAAGMFEELYPLSLGTPRADTILFLFAECYYKNKDYNMAAFHFRDYVKRYPNSDRTEDAFYYCISAIYNSSPDYSLDQSNTEYAIEEIKAFLQAYPNNSHIEECNLMLDNLRVKLARKDLEILKLYYNTDNYEACQIAAKNFFNDYSYSPLMPEAIYYLVLNNYEYARKSVEKKKEERYKACLDACERMERNYPDSKHAKETNRISADVKKNLEKIQKKTN